MPKDNAPYLVTLAVQAIVQSASQWEKNVQAVSKTAETLLPQTSTGLIQAALRVAIARNDNRFTTLSSQQLSEVFNKRVNSYFNTTLLQTFDDTMQFILRVGCVLLRMGRLDKDPKLAKLIYDTGCVKRSLSVRNISQLRKNDVSKLETDLKNAQRFNSLIIKDEELIYKIHKIMLRMPVSKMNMVTELAVVLFNAIADVYDREYSKWASQTHGPIPAEFLMLLNGLSEGSFVAFRATSFFDTTKGLFDLSNTELKSIDVSTLPARLEAKRKLARDSETKLKLKQYTKIMYHAQTLLKLYNTIVSHTHSPQVRSLKKTYAALKVFQEKAPRNISFISQGTFDLSAPFFLYSHYNDYPKNNINNKKSP
jgi:hypothetical protein